jgi:hypothetical protein
VYVHVVVSGYIRFLVQSFFITSKLIRFLSYQHTQVVSNILRP